jgi:hypothetical protein
MILFAAGIMRVRRAGFNGRKPAALVLIRWRPAIGRAARVRFRTSARR